MTIFGWDISDFDLDRGLTAAEVRAGYNVGIRFFTAKLTETAPGQTFTHNRATGLLNTARDVYPFVGSYIVPRSGVSVTVQTSNAISAANRLIPWWKSERKFFWQVDLEHWEYDAVPLWIGVAMANDLKARTGKPVVLYASGGHYGNGPVSRYPRWNPNYFLWQQVADFRALYSQSGGDRGPGWFPAGTVIWQYSDSAIIAGQRSCDANAFRGSVEDFGRMLGITEDTSVLTSAPLAVRAIGGVDMKVNRFFSFEGKPQVFARLDNGLVVHVLSAGELDQLRKQNPDAPSEKLSGAAYSQVASSAKALGYTV